MKAFSDASDERFMRRAIELAERGVGETNPNPPVGCVLVRRGLVVGEGFHERAGSAHAEAIALEKAGAGARGATAYVTLEPCAPNEAKRTPSCALRLLEAGVARVVSGVRDLNPRVRGRGARLLRSSGVAVVEGVCLDATRRLAQHFNEAMRLQRPYITLKAGMTIDGRIATAGGESRWITSVGQRAAARALRRLFDGVVVGIETAIKDDPLLLAAPRTRRPLTRVVLDSSLRLPVHSRLVKSARRSPLIVVCARVSPKRQRALEDKGVTVAVVEGCFGRVSIPAMLRALFTRGVTSLMVEGGSEVMGSFVREGTFDEMVIFQAPLILGGRDSRSVVGGSNPATLGEALTMRRATLGDSATLWYGLQGSSKLDVAVYVPTHRRPAAARAPR